MIALQALAWLAEDADRLGQFMAASGADVTNLRAGAGDPDFLAAVLDHLLAEDHLIVAFCDQNGLDYDTPQRARAALPGGEAVHWT